MDSLLAVVSRLLIRALHCDDARVAGVGTRGERLNALHFGSLGRGNFTVVFALQTTPFSSRRRRVNDASGM